MSGMETCFRHETCVFTLSLLSVERVRGFTSFRNASVLCHSRNCSVRYLMLLEQLTKRCGRSGLVGKHASQSENRS